MYRVFLSYNTPDEMTVVWRLQTLAAASGLHLDVPNTLQRSDWATVAKMIDNADSVIVFLTDKATTTVKTELSYALSKKIPVIPIVEGDRMTGPIQTLLENSGVPVFKLDSRSPWKMENQLSDYLKKKKYDKDAKNAILALAGTFVGLFLLNKLAES
jgi:nucleoside 2-deoxyribosyltransferase